MRGNDSRQPSFSGPGTRASRSLGVLVLLAAAVSADELHLTPAALERLEKIREAIDPAPLFTAPDGTRFLRCIVMAAHPGDPDVPLTEADGKPSFTIIAYGAEGANQSQPVRLSEHWVRIRRNDIDSLLDLRTYASNRDELLNVGIGSARYIAAVLRALDPDGSLGVRPSQAAALPPDGEELLEGSFVLRFKDPPPLLGAGDEPADFLRGHQKRMERIRERIRKRLPTITDPHSHLEPYEDGSALVLSIARARKYPIFESGFDRAAMRILAARTQLVAVDPAQGEYAKRLYEDGRHVLRVLGLLVSGAAPGVIDADDPDAQGALVRDLVRRGMDPESVVERSRRLRASGSPARRTRAEAHGGLPVDPSEVAIVAMDVLRMSNGVFFAGEGDQVGLVRTLVRLGNEHEGDDLRAEDEQDPRPKALQLLVYFMRPPRSRSAPIHAAREEAALRYRGYVQDALFGTDNAGARRLCFDALARGGWQADEKTLSRARHVCRVARDAAQSLARRPSETTAAERAEIGKTLDRSVRFMRDLAALASVDREAEAQIGKVIFDYLAELRQRAAAQPSARILLAKWDALGEGEQRR